MSVFIGYPSFMAYQMMKGKKDNNDGFPSIPGMIARYSASGLTNEHMKENPVWVDKTGNGHDLQLKNFAWGGMSGVGGYVTNKEVYEYDLNKYSYAFIPSERKVHDFYVVFELTGYDESFEDGFNLDVRSTTQGLKKRVTYTKNGIYTFQYKDEEGLDNLLLVGYNGNGGERSTFTVKILPLYPGFILGDGVDDFAVTEKELNFEDTYTVYTAFIPFQNNPTKNMMMAGKDIKDFYMNYSSLNALSYYSGNKSVVINLSNGFNLLCCKRDADNMTIKNLITGDSVTATANEFINNPGLYYLWRVANGYSYARLAIAGQTICNGYFSTDGDDEKVLDWYKKQYSWLFFDQAWTVTGKTNEDEDRATIANITGNGNNLVLSNFGFAEGSGYNEEGEYAGYLVTDGVDDRVVSSSFTLNKDWTIVGNWKMLQPEANKLSGIVKQNSLFIYNHVDGLNISINDAWNFFKLKDIRSVNAICSDGRIYLNDWTEIIDSKQQTVNESVGTLVIGILGNVYTSLAFKNLGIYNNQILSKDDCIKAYNYLQTLKAK